MTTSLPSRCRQARITANIDPRELANRIGIALETVTGYEDPLWPRKREVPYLRRWAQVCHVSEEWLIFGSAPDEVSAAPR
jgi:hypothetical protein